MHCFTGTRVRRLLTNPLEQSQVICASQGNNEVSMWEMETGARQRTLWASSAPPLSLTQVSTNKNCEKRSKFHMYINVKNCCCSF